MDAFFQEYGYVIISIVAMGFMFYFFVVLPTWYKTQTMELMSALTGVPVQTMVEYLPADE